MNIHIWVFVWTNVSIYLGYIPRSGTAGSRGNSVLAHLRDCQAIFQSSCTMFTFPAAVCEVLISPHPWKHLLSTFFINVDFGGGWWCCAFNKKFCVFYPALSCFSQGGCSGSWITKGQKCKPRHPLQRWASCQTLLSLTHFSTIVHSSSSRLVRP